MSFDVIVGATAAVKDATPNKCCNFNFWTYDNNFLAYCNIFSWLLTVIYNVVVY